MDVRFLKKKERVGGKEGGKKKKKKKDALLIKRGHFVRAAVKAALQGGRSKR